MTVLFAVAGACLAIAGVTFAPSLPIMLAGVWLLIAAYNAHSDPRNAVRRRARARRGYIGR